MNMIFPKINSKILLEPIDTDLCPEDIYRQAASKNTALLNSSLETDAGRYSFIGMSPFCSIKVSSGKISFTLNDITETINEDPFIFLNWIFDKVKVNNPTPYPFIAGGIGYFSYDLKDYIEDLPDHAEKDLNIPDLYFVFYRALLIFDNKSSSGPVLSVLDIESTAFTNSQALAHKIKTKIEKLTTSSFQEKTTINIANNLSSTFTKNEYIRAIEKVKEYIRAGDIYQVCLSQRFSTEWPTDPYDLYLKLNALSPAPFSAFLDFEDCKVLSSSPELFLRVNNSTIETRPMKGTRPRKKDPKEDREMKIELQKSKKDEAELSMIIDLERNDLGKIAVPGSVVISEHRRVETYPTVFQTISVIKGLLPENASVASVVRSIFPGGSISGCPKIRAMEIIEELEPTRRGIYTGSIGYLSFHNTMDLNIAIRTIILKDKTAYYQTGGGITIDSDPELEYEETLHKAKAFFDIIK